ncbi:MAG: RND transporter [Planctomycetaceae bacterium]
MTTRKLGTAGTLLAALMFAANGCGESAAPPKQVAQTDNHDHKDGKKEHDHSGWWCGEHGVPEAECSLCNSKLTVAFKAKNDWCNEHDRAKSQCFICDPKLKEKFAALYRAKEGQEPPAIEEDAPATESKTKGI